MHDEHAKDSNDGPVGPIVDIVVRAAIDGSGLSGALHEVAVQVDAIVPATTEGRLANDTELRIRLAKALVRNLWQQMPDPGRNFSLPAAPSGDRYRPCPCGSGRKYKFCCEEIDRSLPPLEFNLLTPLLELLPPSRWSELTGRLDLVEHLADATGSWRLQDRSADIIALLSPWFRDDRHLVAHCEVLLDRLLDAYGDDEQDDLKMILLQRAAERGDAAVRCGALLRMATIVAGNGGGDYREVWRLFQAGQQADPGSPMLSHTEVTLLISEGRQAEARERARYWLGWLRRSGDLRLEGLRDFLQRVVDVGAAAVVEASLAGDEGAQALLAALRSAPALACHYELDPAPSDESRPDATPGTRLRPDAQLADALARWREVIPARRLSLTMGDEVEAPWRKPLRWLSLLEQEPLLWQSFEVLADVWSAMLQSDNWAIEEEGYGELLGRGTALLQLVLTRGAVADRRFEWVWEQNRPALTLLFQDILEQLDDPPSAERVRRLEWAVLTLNPNDNFGLRNPLMQCYFELRQIDRALQLADRYPDDLAEMSYSRALALFAAGRTVDAERAIRAVAAEFPKPLKLLLAKQAPRQPAMGDIGVRVGGDDEAWLYRKNYLGYWKAFGAIDWLRGLKLAGD